MGSSQLGSRDVAVAGRLAAGLFLTVSACTVLAGFFIAEGRRVFFGFGAFGTAAALGLWLFPWTRCDRRMLHAVPVTAITSIAVFQHVHGHSTLRQGFMVAMVFAWTGLCIGRRPGPYYAAFVGIALGAVVYHQTGLAHALGLVVPLMIECTIVTTVLAGIQDRLIASFALSAEAQAESDRHSADLRHVHRVVGEEAARLGADADAVSADAHAAAAAAEQMWASLRAVDEASSQSLAVAGAAASKAAGTAELIARLAASSAEIGSVLGVVRDMAEQSNLLALNATIEAARAGDAGKGFAVVAAEVKTMAGQTNDSARDIEDKVAAISAAISSATTALSDVSATIAEITEHQQAVCSAVRQQTEMTERIVASVTRSANGTGDIASGARSLRDRL